MPKAPSMFDVDIERLPDGWEDREPALWPDVYLRLS
jgi:hypothetical protein